MRGEFSLVLDGTHVAALQVCARMKRTDKYRLTGTVAKALAH